MGASGVDAQWVSLKDKRITMSLESTLKRFDETPSTSISSSKTREGAL
jgi:hypothetical protein